MVKRFHAVILLVAMMLMTIFLCFGYAALTDALSVTGSASVEPPDTLVITNIETLDGATVNSQTHNKVMPTNAQLSINGNKGRSVTYRITVYNYSQSDTFVFNGLRYDDAFADELDKMTVKISADQEGNKVLTTTPETVSVEGTAVAPGEEFVFYVTYTLKENLSAENILINYSFDEVIYSVTYLDNNEVWAIDHIIHPNSIYYVRGEGPVDTSGQNRKFADWINANAVPVDSYPAGNTNDYTLSAKWENLYLIMFVDKNGDVLYQETFTTSSTALSSSGKATVDAILADLNANADKDMTVTWSDYTIKGAKADIVVRPLYTYTGNLQFQPVDANNDGITDHYKVVAVSALNDPVYIPGIHQGLPVKIVEKLYKNDNNFDYGAGIHTITIDEGVEELAHNSLSHTSELNTVYLPHSLKYLDKNVFSRNWGDDKKIITIYYNGTMAEWKAIEKHEDWDNGITTKDGSKVMCSDGYFEFDYGFIGIGAKWEEHPY